MPGTTGLSTVELTMIVDKAQSYWLKSQIIHLQNFDKVTAIKDCEKLLFCLKKSQSDKAFVYAVDTLKFTDCKLNTNSTSSLYWAAKEDVKFALLYQIASDTGFVLSDMTRQSLRALIAQIDLIDSPSRGGLDIEEDMFFTAKYSLLSDLHRLRFQLNEG